MKSLLLVLSLACVAAPALAQDSAPSADQVKPAPSPRTAMDDCLGKVKSVKDIERMTLQTFDDSARARVGDELGGYKVCEAIVTRAADPCASLTGLGKVIGGTDKRVEGDMIGRCRDSVRFARFYQESLHATAGEKRFPACLDYFRHNPIIEVRSGFEAICGDVSQFIQHREDKFCDPRIDPYVKDQQKWGVFCKVIGGIYLRGSNTDCSYFPEPGRCAAMAAQVPAFQMSRADMCTSTLEGGVCHAYIPIQDKTVSRCKLPWLQLSRDYCQGLVASGAFNNPGKSETTAPSEDK